MGRTYTHLGDGQAWYLPIAPRTWVGQAGATRGDGLRAKWLTMDVGGAVAWHRRPPLVQALRTTALSVPASAWTAVPLDRELIDTHSGHNDEAQTSRWYSPDGANTTDWWLFNGHLPFGGGAGGVRIAGLRLNGAGTVFEGMKVTATAAHACSVQVIDLLQMTSDGQNYAEMMAQQTLAGALNTVASGKTPSLTARWACSGSGTVVALPAAPRTWLDTDVLSAGSTTGGRIPLNTHIRDVLRFLNYPPVARITSQGTTQTLASGTVWTSIQMPAETVDNYSGHDNLTNNSRYTFQRPGLYYVAGLSAISEGDGGNSSAGYRACRLLQTFAAGGTLVHPGTSTIPISGTATNGTAIYAEGFLRVAAGDFVELQMIQGGTGTRAVRSGAGDCSRLIAVWMSF